MSGFDEQGAIRRSVDPVTIARSTPAFSCMLAVTI
jgi:hypothetical protein